MSTTGDKDDQSLIDTYNQMMARVKDSIESAESNAVPTLQKAIDMAKKQAIHLGEVTLEEAEEIGNYIKRDINDAAEYLMETSQEFSEWLMLDIDIIEQKVLELFFSVADKTRLELEQLAHLDCQVNLYHAGEITGPGTLVCVDCGHQVQFQTTGEIPHCPGCKHKQFKRADK